MKKFKFTLIYILINFFLIEAIGFTYFNFFSNDKKNLELYINKRAAADQYKYFESVNLVLPKPNIKNYHYTREFTDIFETKDILNNGMGFFDDGINNKEIKAVAIGDSITRGHGSIDNLKNGWVELVEKNYGNIDIVNLSHLGMGISSQIYGYNQIKKLIDHELIIYSFFGGNYIDNLDDKVVSYYMKKKSGELSNFELQEMITDLNKRHGFKHYLEYLKDNKYRSYSFYLCLKIIDYLNIKRFIDTHKYSFNYSLPGSEARINVVEDELYKYHNFRGKIRCINKKYCVRENEIFENEIISKKIIQNTSNKINSFFKDTMENQKKFILIILPSSRQLYPNETNIDYNTLNQELIEKLEKKIKIINLTNELKEIDRKNSEINLFYEYDGHYTIEGYKIVSNIISKN